jgi:hypothetical protein
VALLTTFAMVMHEISGLLMKASMLFRQPGGKPPSATA